MLKFCFFFFPVRVCRGADCSRRSFGPRAMQIYRTSATQCRAENSRWQCVPETQKTGGTHLAFLSPLSPSITQNVVIKIAQEPNCLADSLAPSLSLSLLVANGAISQYAGGATNLNLLHCAVFTSIHQVEAMPMTRVKCFYACDPPGDLMNGGAATAAATTAAALQSESNCRICILKSFICSNEFTCVSAQAGELASYNCSRYVFESVSDLWCFLYFCNLSKIWFIFVTQFAIRCGQAQRVLLKL